MDTVGEQSASAWVEARNASSSSISTDGRLVAVSFENGGFEVSDYKSGDPKWIHKSQMHWESTPLPPLIWSEFVLPDDSCVVGEDANGMIWVIDERSILDRIGPLPHPGRNSIAAVSGDGSRVVRACLNPSDGFWSQNITLLDIYRDHITVRPLAPSFPAPRGSAPTGLIARSLGFSPDGSNVGAFDGHQAHVWSAGTGALIASYTIKEPGCWSINLNSTLKQSQINAGMLLYPPAPSENPPHPDNSGSFTPDDSPQLHIASSVFAEVSPKYFLGIPPRTVGRKFTGLVGPECLFVNEGGYVYYMGQNPIVLPTELIPSPNGRLRYVVRGGTVRLLLGGGPIPYAAAEGSDSQDATPDSRNVAYIPPVVIDLSEYCASISRIL